MNEVIMPAALVQQALEDLPNDNKPDTKASKRTSYKSIFISDVHMGTKDCKADYLLEFFKHNTCDQLYLVGDIFDGWKMKSGIYWHKSFNKLIRRVLKLTKKGIPVYYITGNHDEFLRRFANTSFDSIHLVNRTTHTTVDGKKILVIHGDQFESVTHCSKFLKFVGDKGYDILMKVNRACNRVRAKYGYGYWSFAAFLKDNVKTAKEYILRYEQAVAHGAKKQGYDGVICGHIHQAANKTIEGVNYLNTGDWVESCTAIVETHNGEFQLINWLEQRETVAIKKKGSQIPKSSIKPAYEPA